MTQPRRRDFGGSDPPIPSKDEVLSRHRYGPAMIEELARRIEETLPAGVAFALLTFNVGEDGYGGYISNAERDDMILALREAADRLEPTNDSPGAAPTVRNH